MDRAKLTEFLNNGFSLRKISKETGSSLTSLRYWVKKYNLKLNAFNKWNKDKLIELVLISHSKSDILREMGLTLNAGNYRTLNRYLKKYEIDTSKLKYDFTKKNLKNQKYSNNEIFCVNSTYNPAHLKNRILRDNLIEYKCVECNNSGEWNGKKLVLQVDHINGINDDNRLENLRFLCPNCHSQTETFSNKNKR